MTEVLLFVNITCRRISKGINISAIRLSLYSICKASVTNRYKYVCESKINP